MKQILTSILFLICLTINAQETMNDLSYATIPEAPENFTAGAVVSRIIDGLGFRYYWASEGLTADDLKYTPGNDGRSLEQTINHIYGLSDMILNAAKNSPNDRTTATKKMSPMEQRKKTLENLKEASVLFAASTDLNSHNIIFENKKGTTTFPFWNGLNGPVEDAIWHAGQLVVLRRSAGNPINSKVNVFLGKLNE